MSVPTDDITGEPVAANHERKQRHPLLVWAWSLVHLDFVGIAFGALFFCLSLTPSLLPRDWLFQGLIGGINAAIGYGIGVFTGKMVRRFVLRRRIWWPPPKRVLYWLKAVTVVLATAASLLMLIPAAAWQRRVSAVMGIEGPATLGYLRTLIIAVLVGGVCVSLARAVIDLIKTMARYFIRRWHLHDEVALFIGTAIVVVLSDHADQRRADPRLPRGRQPGVPAAELHHAARRSSNRSSPNDPAAQRRSRRGTRWAFRAATSSPPDRTPTN